MGRVKVVVGANFGDEGKGRATSFFSYKSEGPVLNVLFNGGAQRGHTAHNHIFHCFGSGYLDGADTYYNRKFVVDPIGFKTEGEDLDIKKGRVFIDKNCLVSTPYDILINQVKEESRGEHRHGSCGMGIFETLYRSKFLPIYARDIMNPHVLYEKLRYIKDFWIPMRAKELGIESNLNTNYNILFMLFLNSCDYISTYAVFVNNIEEVLKDYNTVIFEGAQGLGLSMKRMEYYPHLTPSYTGCENILPLLGNYCQDIPVEINYITRTYTTRHGAGPLELECKKEDINSSIIDKTNEENKWQGAIRYGYFNPDLFSKLIDEDFNKVREVCHHATQEIIITHGDYTNNKMCVGKNTYKTFGEIFGERYKAGFLSNEVNK